MTAAEGEVPVLTARTRAVDPVSSLLPLLDARSPLLFMRRGEGVAGLGEALRLSFRGRDRIAQAAETWRRIAASATVDDPVRRSGSGLVAFGAFTFDAGLALETFAAATRQAPASFRFFPARLTNPRMPDRVAISSPRS